MPGAIKAAGSHVKGTQATNLPRGKGYHATDSQAADPMLRRHAKPWDNLELKGVSCQKAHIMAHHILKQRILEPMAFMQQTLMPKALRSSSPP